MERWLFRGAMLGILMHIAIVVTALASRGLTTPLKRILVTVLVILAIASTLSLASMRLQDLKICRELQRRRRAGLPHR